MNDPSDDKLDRLLNEWAAAQRPDGAHLEALRRRVSEAADELASGHPCETALAATDAATAGDSRSIAVPAGPRTWRRRLAWFSLGTAGAIVAAVLLLSMLRSNPARDAGGQQTAELPALPCEVRLDQQQLFYRARLFTELKRVFASDLAWMAESDGKVLLGVESPGRKPPAGSQPITVRLVVMARKPGETSWYRRNGVDVIMHDEEFLEFGPQEGVENQLALWVHRLPDGMIAIDTRLGIEPSDRPALSSSGIQRPNVPEPILTLRTEEAEYRVFQTVAVLPREVESS